MKNPKTLMSAFVLLVLVIVLTPHLWTGFVQPGSRMLVDETEMNIYNGKIRTCRYVWMIRWSVEDRDTLLTKSLGETDHVFVEQDTPWRLLHIHIPYGLSQMFIYTIAGRRYSNIDSLVRFMVLNKFAADQKEKVLLQSLRYWQEDPTPNPLDGIAKDYDKYIKQALKEYDSNK